MGSVSNPDSVSVLEGAIAGNAGEAGKVLKADDVSLAALVAAGVAEVGKAAQGSSLPLGRFYVRLNEAGTQVIGIYVGQKPSAPIFFETTGIPADGSVTLAKIAAAIIDGVAGTPSLRSLTTASPFTSAAGNSETASRKAVADALMILAGRYRNLLTTSGKGATSAASAGTKYFLIPGSQDTTTFTPGTTNAFPFYPLKAEDLAIGELKTKLRILGVWKTGSVAPGVTATVSLYKLSGSATSTLGAAVTGSGADITTPAKESEARFVSADFDLPADGIYVPGYTLSGAPAASFTFPSAILQVHSTE